MCLTLSFHYIYKESVSKAFCLHNYPLNNEQVHLQPIMSIFSGYLQPLFTTCRFVLANENLRAKHKRTAAVEYDDNA